MNTTIFTKCILTVCIALFSLSVSAQKAEIKPLDKEVVTDLSTTPNMALGLQKERHIKGAFKFFEQMLQSDLPFENFEIVIWGEAVQHLKKGTELSRLIGENQHPKLRVSVCQQAMKRFNITEKDLPDGVISVQNAFLRLLQIQAKGYNVVVP